MRLFLARHDGTRAPERPRWACRTWGIKRRSIAGVLRRGRWWRFTPLLGSVRQCWLHKPGAWLAR